jgi:hypothetical protein
MAQYKVLSNRLADFNEGDVIDETSLNGLNIDALISGEHIEVVKSAKKSEEVKDK